MKQPQCHDCEMLGRLLGIAFIGLHLPLFTVGIAYFLMGVTDAGDLVLSALVGTLLSSVLTLGVMWRSIGPRLIGQLGQTGYKPGLLAPN